MTTTISAQAPARLVFDKDGDVDQQTMQDLVDAIRTAAVTDLFMFSHGWNNDEAGEETFGGDWFHTKDAAQKDEDGYIWYAGRADDVIISAGYRIGPFEVESALVAHPAVAEAAVVSAPDDERGAVVRAVVVLRDGHAPSEALARELQDHVKAQTAPYKYPRIVDFAAELPKTPSGKVRRAALRGPAA